MDVRYSFLPVSPGHSKGQKEDGDDDMPLSQSLEVGNYTNRRARNAVSPRGFQGSSGGSCEGRGAGNEIEKTNDSC